MCDDAHELIDDEYRKRPRVATLGDVSEGPRARGVLLHLPTMGIHEDVRVDGDHLAAGPPRPSIAS